MGVFPAASGKFLPPAFRALMSEEVQFIFGQEEKFPLLERSSFMLCSIFFFEDKKFLTCCTHVWSIILYSTCSVFSLLQNIFPFLLILKNRSCESRCIKNKNQLYFLKLTATEIYKWCSYTPQHSTIIDFYPSDFKVDLNGKKYMWQGVALLPFVDESRLLRALKDFYHTLSPEEGLLYFWSFLFSF